MARGPADEIGPRTEEHEHSLDTSRSRLETAFGAKTAGGTWQDGRRRRDQATTPSRTYPTRLALAVRVRRWAARQRRRVHAGPRAWGTRQLDRPDGPSDTRKVRGIMDLLVSQEFGPRAIGRLREIVHRSFREPMPPSGGLGRRLPEERKARIGVAKDDHVAAPTPAREAASRRTLSTSGEAGSHAVPRTSRGERPSSCVRSRSNQRRAPTSL